jgi:hypothetical protein
VSTGVSANAREKAALIWSRAAADDLDGDAAAAVVAHGLLGNLAVVRGATRMLLADNDLGARQRADLVNMLEAQIDLMQGVLTDLVRGLPSNALVVLDELRSR